MRDHITPSARDYDKIAYARNLTQGLYLALGTKGRITMKLVIISGFLGSGKTTLLLGLVRRLTSENGFDFVILENEVGEISIDGAFLEKQGLQVKELYSGCVCCQLAGDLVVTLRDIKEALDPDCVILEASGLARVENILKTLDKYYQELEGTFIVSLADLERFELYLDEPMPFVTNQLKLADLVVLNKTDSGDGELADTLKAKLAELNHGAEVIGISALEGSNLDLVAERLGAWMRTTS
jgi:G3E family GTPase